MPGHSPCLPGDSSCWLPGQLSFPRRAPPAAPAPEGTPAPYLARTVQPTGCQEGASASCMRDPGRGEQSHCRRDSSIRDREAETQRGRGRVREQKETVKTAKTETDSELPVQAAQCRGWRSGEPTRVPSEWLRSEAGPPSPILGPELWALDGPALGRSLGSPAPAVRGGGPPGPSALSPLALPPRGQTQGHSRLPRRAYWAARVAFKISLANQIWLFQEAPSLAVPSAGRDLHIPGSLVKYPLWPEQQRKARSQSPGAGRAWACGRLFGKAAPG